MIFPSFIHPDWSVIENKFDIANNRHYESLFALGSGYLTARASIEEGFEDDDQSTEFERFMGNTTLETMKAAKSKWGTYMPVIQARHPYLMTGIVNQPYFLGLVVYADGEKLDLETSKVTGYRRWLDLKTATLYRTLVWETKSGQQVELNFVRFMNPEEKFVCVQHGQLKMLSGSAEIKVVSTVDNNVRTNGFDKFTRTAVDHKGGVIYSDVTTNRNNRIITASAMISTSAADEVITQASRRISTSAAFQLQAGETAAVTKVSAVITDMYFPVDQLVEVAVEMVNRNLSHSIDDLHQAHAAVWNKYWSAFDVEIEATDRAGYNSQQAIRMAIYHLLRAKAPDEERGALCPKGTTADTYYGSVFWDTDIFHLPYYVYTNPPAARAQVMFRYHTLPAARAIARGYDYPGARFAWQSDVNGEETCVLWQYADHQVHINSDVAVAVWHYYAATGDVDFLFDYGAEILLETARYWTERVDAVPGRPGYQLLGVMGPDEYKPLTNNNAYTNYTARLNLNLAVKVARRMAQQAPDKFERLIQKIDLQECELDRFTEIAAGISLPIDQERHLIWQCDDFDTAFAELDIDEIWKDRNRMFGSYISQEKRYRSKCLKQADVVALLAVFPDSFTFAEKEASLAYNAKYCIHDSSNSMSHHSMVSSYVGLKEQAYEYWLGAIRIDFWDLPRSSDGIHMTNVAGMWQAIAFGFGGMATALNTDVLTFNPCLPEEFQRIRFQAQWKGQRFAVTVTKECMQLENLSDMMLAFRVKDQTGQIAAHARAEVSYL